MTWGECKLICLQTMFANEGVTILQDDSTEEYLNAMPGKANEGLIQLSLVGRPLIKRLRIAVDMAEAEAEVHVSGTVSWQTVDVTALAPRFRAVDYISCVNASGTGLSVAVPYQVEGEHYVRIYAPVAGLYSLYYLAYPEQVTRETPDEQVLDIHEECASLLPVYMAAELYKDDDLALATVLRNEYEDGLSKVRAAWETAGRGGLKTNVRVNTTGWW